LSTEGKPCKRGKGHPRVWHTVIDQSRPKAFRNPRSWKADRRSAKMTSWIRSGTWRAESSSCASDHSHQPGVCVKISAGRSNPTASRAKPASRSVPAPPMAMISSWKTWAGDTRQPWKADGLPSPSAFSITMMQSAAGRNSTWLPGVDPGCSRTGPRNCHWPLLERRCHGKLSASGKRSTIMVIPRNCPAGRG